MAALIAFMNGFWGRAIRIIVGVALIGYGLLSLGGTTGLIIAIIGVVPLAMGIWGRCLFELIYHPTRGTV
jgi:hypothetical protein